MLLQKGSWFSIGNIRYNLGEHDRTHGNKAEVLCAIVNILHSVIDRHSGIYNVLKFFFVKHQTPL